MKKYKSIIVSVVASIALPALVYAFSSSIINGNISVGSGYTSFNAPTDGLIVQGNSVFGSSISHGFKLEVNGDVRATQVVSNNISASGSNQSISLNPTGVGKVLVSGDSIVVASKSSDPASPQAGQIYFNSTTGKFRGYNGSSWITFSSPTLAPVSLLVIGGAGGGGKGIDSGNTSGGGGGAGGYQSDATHIVSIQAYTVTVGAGGTGSSSPSNKGSDGGNSVFDTIIAAGGGGGGSANTGTGSNGGSGGGAGGKSGSSGGTGSQGSNGGTTPSAASNGGGGGGGGSTAGNNGSSTMGGNGGNGISSSISGTSVTYAGGGGGGGFSGGPGTGGSGGGGNGSDGGGCTSGTANLGGGGGGSGDSDSIDGCSGGSGVVIVSYPTGSMSATGGTITTSGGNTIHTFTGSGTFTVTAI